MEYYMNWLKAIWLNHGTKVIGFGGTILGAISMIDATTVHLIEGTLGAHWGHRVSAGLLIMGGIGTAVRGFNNSKRGP